MSGFSEAPMPIRSSARHRQPAAATGPITLRHKKDDVGFPCPKPTAGRGSGAGPVSGPTSMNRISEPRTATSPSTLPGGRTGTVTGSGY